MAFPSNPNLAIIPFDNQESSFVLPALLYIDSYGVTHPAYSLMEEASSQGERRNHNLRSDLGDETIARSEGEPISSKEQVHSSCDEDDDIPLVQLVSKRLRSHLSKISCQPIAMILPDAHESPISNPSVKAPVRVTQSVQHTRDAMLLAKSTKKTRSLQKWQIQTIKDVLGLVDHETIPAIKRWANAPVQRLKASITAKDKELDALLVAHSAELNQLRITHELEREKLIAENCKVKDELAQAQVALHNEWNINSGHLKSIFELLSKGSSSSSSLVPSSDSTLI